MLFEMAHDVNNALAVISGNVTLLLDELPPGSGAAGDVREIGDAADRAAARIRQVLQGGRRPPPRGSSPSDAVCPDPS